MGVLLEFSKKRRISTVLDFAMESFSFASDLAIGGAVFKDGGSGGRSSFSAMYIRGWGFWFSFLHI